MRVLEVEVTGNVLWGMRKGAEEKEDGIERHH